MNDQIQVEEVWQTVGQLYLDLRRLSADNMRLREELKKLQPEEVDDGGT